MEKCIDISKHQTAFDAGKCKSAGISTVICRLAYGASTDARLSQYAPAAGKAGLSLGGYGFGTWHYKTICDGDKGKARTEMRKQVNAWIKLAQQYGCSSWVAIDQELESGCTMGLSVADNTALLAEAAQMIESAGLHACLYASASWIMAHVALEQFTYPLWVAYYKWYGTQKSFENVSETFPVNSGAYGKWMNQYKDRICMWQFSSEGYADLYGCTHGTNGLDKNWLYFQPGKAAASPAPAMPEGASGDGGAFDEYCLFPMEVLRVTQGPGFAVDGVAACTYSHKGQTAYDIAGADTGKSPVYAPFSCVVKRIYNGSTTASKCNFTWYANTKRVKALNGKVYAPGMLIFMAAHCDTANMTKYGIKAGAVFGQGEICGYEGQAGGVANHCHITFGEGPWSGTGWHCAAGAWEINNPVFMHQVCWLRPDCVVKDGGGYPWKVLTGSIGVALGGSGAVTNPEKPAAGVSSGCEGVCFPAYTGSSGSIVGALKTVGAETTYSYRAKIAAANGIEGYRGSAAQNVQMLNLLKAGRLVRPEAAAAGHMVYVGPVSSGDAVQFYNLAKQLDLVSQKLYSSAYTDSGKAMQNITIGPVTDGDAKQCAALAEKLALVRAGLYKVT